MIWLLDHLFLIWYIGNQVKNMNFPYFLSKIMKDGCFGLKSSLLGQCLCHPIIEECVFLNSKKKMQVNSMLTSLFVRFDVKSILTSLFVRFFWSISTEFQKMAGSWWIFVQFSIFWFFPGHRSSTFRKNTVRPWLADMTIKLSCTANLY